jgi:hypothetical protein
VGLFFSEPFFVLGFGFGLGSAGNFRNKCYVQEWISSKKSKNIHTGLGFGFGFTDEDSL